MTVEFQIGIDTCDYCDDEICSNATVACTFCLLKLCNNHKKLHLLSKDSKYHELVPLEFIDSDTVMVKYGKLCDLHSLVLNKYCKDCKKMICSKCSDLSPHSTHQDVVQFLKDIVPEWVINGLNFI